MIRSSIASLCGLIELMRTDCLFFPMACHHFSRSSSGISFLIGEPVLDSITTTVAPKSANNLVAKAPAKLLPMSITVKCDSGKLDILKNTPHIFVIYFHTLIHQLIHQ